MKHTCQTKNGGGKKINTSDDSWGRKSKTENQAEKTFQKGSKPIKICENKSRSLTAVFHISLDYWTSLKYYGITDPVIQRAIIHNEAKFCINFQEQNFDNSLVPVCLAFSWKRSWCVGLY